MQCTDIFDRVPLAVLSLKIQGKIVACASYEIKIFETEKDSEEATITEEFESHEMFQKLELEAVQDDLTSLKVFWTYDDHPRCPKRFQVKVFQDNVLFKSIEISKVAETITDLEPCEVYLITVNPVHKEEALTIYGDSLNFTMNSAIPSVIRDLNLDYNEGEESIDISWIAPNFGSKCVKNYSIQAESDYDNRTKYATAINVLQKENIANVFACTDYKIRIVTNTIHEKKGAEIFAEILIPSRSKNNIKS